jgi:hypothetical protein
MILIITLKQPPRIPRCRDRSKYRNIAWIEYPSAVERNVSFIVFFEASNYL